MTGKTETNLDSTRRMLAYRWQTLARDRCAISGLTVFTQIFIGMALYLYDQVSTPGYLSILLALPFALGILALARAAARRADPQTGVLLSALGEKAVRPALLLFAMLHLLDGLLVFVSICAVLLDVMPDHNLWKISLAVSLALAWANGGRQTEALSRLARFIKWVLIVLLGYCLISAVPYGRAAHFFPLLGSGWGSIGKGALWISGAAWGCVWPLLAPQHANALSSMTADRPGVYAPAAAAMGGGAVMMLFSVWLMPVYAMARRETLGWRLLLLTNMTPSIPAWSMEALALLLLFFLALSFSISQAAGLLARIGGKEAPRPGLFLLLMLFLLPVSAAQMPEIQHRLALAALVRGPAALFLLLLIAVCGRLRGNRKEAAA